MAMTDSEINQYMIAALVEAKKAAAIGEVPIGAVVVHDQQIIGRGYNLRETTQDATQHAEILAIQAACRQTWHLAFRRLQFVCHIRTLSYVRRGND